MAMCECAPRCPFYNGKMAQVMPVVVQMMKKRYCEGDKTQCARYVVFCKLGKGSVPPDLVPSQLDRAQALVGA